MANKPQRAGKKTVAKHSAHSMNAPLHFEYSPNVMTAVFGAVAVFLILRAGAILLMDAGDRVWGLDYARYILSWDIWIALLLPLLFCVPAVATATARPFHAWASGNKPALYYTVGLLLTALLVVLANQAQVLSSFLGDGSYCHAEVYRVMVDPSMQSQLFDKPTAYATGQLLRYVASHTKITDTREPFMMMSMAGVIILVPGLFLLLRNEKRFISTLLITAFLGTPAILFFFGYIELYTLQYVFLALFFVAAYRSLTSNSGILLPIILLVTSVAFGGSSMIYIPAVLFLAATLIVKDSALHTRVMSALIGLSVLAFVVLLLIQWDDMRSPYLIPLVTGNLVREDGIMTGWFGYSMLSGVHIADMLNTLLFNGGIVLITGLAAFAVALRSDIWRSAPVQFGAVAAAAGFLLLLGGNASFGLARDWDLAVPAVVGITFFTAALLAQLHTAGKISLPMLLPVIVLTSLGTVYSWVSLNHRPESAQRLENIIAMDDDYVQPIITYTGYENLRKYYTSMEMTNARARVLKKMIETGWHIDILYNEGVTQAMFFPSESRQNSELDWYFTHLAERLQKQYPEHHYRYIAQSRLNEMVAGLLLFMQPDKPAYTAEYNEMIHREVPAWPYYKFVSIAADGSIPINLKYQYSEGMVPLSATDPILLARMGDFYQFGKQYQSALQYYSRAVEVSPHDYPNIYMTIAGIQAGVFGEPASAVATLDRCIENCRLSPQLSKVREMRAEIQRRMQAVAGH